MSNIILLTGSTGFVGAHLLQAMMNDSNIDHVYILIREKKGFPSIEQRLQEALKKFGIGILNNFKKITFINGDIKKQNFGISQNEWNRLANEVDCIWHIGARVNHVQSYEMLKLVNVDSVNRLIDLCNLGKPKILNFTSTLGAGVDTDKNGFILESFTKEDTIFHSKVGYLQTKFEAEKILRKFHFSGGNVNIIRLGYISGHSKTGIMPYENNQFLLFLKSCIEMKQFPILQRNINFTPVDKIAEVMLATTLMKDKGKVINGYNYNGIITLENLMKYLNKLGFEINPYDFYIWQKNLYQLGDTSPLYRFFNMYCNKYSKDNILNFGIDFCYENMKICCNHNKIYLPSVYDLLDTYVSYLINEEFFITT